MNIRTDDRTCRSSLLPVQSVGKGAHVPTADMPDSTRGVTGPVYPHKMSALIDCLANM
jgi:hypothetical protein